MNKIPDFSEVAFRRCPKCGREGWSQRYLPAGIKRIPQTMDLIEKGYPETMLHTCYSCGYEIETLTMDEEYRVKIERIRSSY